MSFEELALNRYSLRSFSDKPVETEKINKILEAARIAPTACNNQPQRIKVLSSDEDLQRLEEVTPFRYGTPLSFLICYDTDKAANTISGMDIPTTGPVDATIAATHVVFAAEDLGLGTLWLMHFDPVKTSEVFNLPENIKPITIINVGYPAENAAPAGLHSKRNPLSEMLL